MILPSRYHQSARVALSPKTLYNDLTSAGLRPVTFVDRLQNGEKRELENEC